MFPALKGARPGWPHLVYLKLFAWEDTLAGLRLLPRGSSQMVSSFCHYLLANSCQLKEARLSPAVMGFMWACVSRA